MTKTGQQLPKNRILTHPANTRPGTCTRSQCKNTNSQDNTAPLESRNPTVVDTERSNEAEAQDKDFPITVTDILKNFKEGMNNCLKEDHEYRSS